ncbi:hypothetical protein CK203_087878 [Vitis vinifera]|uniref:Uncharacterized protein n=1 Tax=Vitis vinifera TaxID=29760 RepID=A0A438DQS4_VITVI|nr:hypothetical protein CK203_087878 [Vitis vinifera]
MSMIRNQSVVVERKIFQVKSEDYNGGKWLSITERSQGFVVSLDFGEEETGWLVEQLEKAVELEDSRGYIRKMRGKTRTHMMEICFNSRGKVIASVQEISVQVGRESQETQNKLQESKGMYRGERTYAEVVAEKGTRNGAGMPVGKWARAVVCEGKEKYVTGVRKAQWFQERGSFTVRGEVFALRRWSPEENSVVRGKFRRGWLELRGLPFHLWDEVQLSHVLQQWGRVTKVARNSLKFVDLSKVTLRVEMLPKVVLPALLEVEDGDRTYTVAVTVTGEDDGEDDGGDSIKPESSRSKDELRSAGGCVLQKPQMVEGLRAIDRTSDCQRWMPRHRLHFSSSDSKSAKGEKGKGRWVLGPMAGSNFGPTPDVLEARCCSSSSKLQRPGLSAKNKASEGLPQVSSKTKGSPVSVRRRARSGPPRFDEAFSSPKRSFEGWLTGDKSRHFSGQISLQKERFPLLFLSEIFLCLGLLSQILFPKPRFLWSSFLCHSSSSYPLESSHAFQRGETLSNLEVRGVSGEASFPVQEPSTLPLEGFQVEGLTPRKMVKVQSVLESLRVRIVRDNGKGVEGENRNPLCGQGLFQKKEEKGFWNSRRGLVWVRVVLGCDCSHEDFKLEYKRFRFRKKRRTVRRFLSTQNPDVVMLQETKREIWDRRLVSSIWKGKSLDWVALPACGASGGIVILWDSVKFNCSEKVLGSFSVTVKLNSDEEGGDFNVIRRISEKMGDLG